MPLGAVSPRIAGRTDAVFSCKGMAMLDLCFCRMRVRSWLMVVLAAYLGTLAGCGAKSQPVANSSSQFRPADEASPDATVGRVSATLEEKASSNAQAASRGDRI